MVNVLLQFFTQLRKNLWRIKKQPLKYGYFSIPLTFSKNIIGLIFVYYYFGWEGIIIGHLISQLFFSIIAIYSFIKSKLLSFKYFKKYTKDMLTVGVPISIHKIGTWLSTALNRVYINNFIGATATGVFGISATFGTIITVIGDAINQAYAPYLYERLKTFNKNTQIQLVKLISYYYLFYFLVAFLIFLTGYYGVQIIFGDSYIEARKYVFPLVLTATINALYKIHVNFIFFTKKTFIISRITILCGALNIGLAYFSIKFYGMLGAAYSGLIIQVLIYLLILFFSYKEYKLPWSNIFNINK
jgi:O-antigen/teichoic acid export membrane protein